MIEKFKKDPAKHCFFGGIILANLAMFLPIVIAHPAVFVQFTVLTVFAIAAVNFLSRFMP